MVQVRAHGGSCCGAYHISGFDEMVERNPDLIDQAVAQCPPGRQLEAILNHTQVANKPRTMQRLADLGFVLVGHTRNSNHDSHIYTFHRDDRREPLMAGPIDGRWPGMIITPGLTGQLPRPNPNAVARPGTAIVAGRRCLVNSLRSTRNGGIYTVLRTEHRDGEPYVVMADHDRNNEEFAIVTYNCQLQALTPEEMARGVPVVRQPMVHVEANGQQVRLQPAPAPAPDIVVVTSFFTNAYRTTGRSEHRYTTAAGAIARRVANARGVRLDRCDILSNGVNRWYTDCDNDGTGGILAPQ